MKKITILLLLIFPVNATQLKVPSAYSTIQAGLNAASSGDTVLVAAGTYAENIIWPDVNGIKLISAGDSSNTIIDGGGTSSVIYMNPSSATIDTTTLIQGFKITNGGNVSKGGGILLYNVSPKLIGLSIFNNTTTFSWPNRMGGGIYMTNSNPILTDVSIENNSSWQGCGLSLYSSNPTLTNVEINNNYGNSGDSQGGGMYIDTPSSPILNDVLIKGNSVARGGGIYIEGSGPIFNNIRIEGNYASGSGGGLRIKYSSPNITNAIIMGNSSPEGGGIAMYFSSPTFSNVLIKGNIAQPRGGGIYIEGRTSIPSMYDVTIVENFGSNGAGVMFSNSYDPNFNNVNIVYNNGVGIVIEGSNSTPPISNVNIIGNEIGILAQTGTNPTILNSNIFNNGSGLLMEGNLPTIIAIEDYWGHSSGPYHSSQNASGKGDSVNAFVNVDPWLTAPNTDAPPIPAQNLTLTASTATSASFSWDASKMGDIAGYKFYYDTDSSGYHYANSVDLGNVVTKSLTGLTAGKTYYVAVSTYDTDGNESWYSKEVSVTMNNTPVIAAVSDVTMNEDESSTITLTATDVENDAITYSAVSDTNTVSVSVSSATLTLTPNANWHGVANIKAYASDGSSKDSTSFKLTVTPINDAPTAFEWVSIALDTVNITQSNLADTYTLQWGGSTDPIDGDSITYLLYAGTGASPKEEVYDTTSTSLPIPYQEFLQKTFEQIPMLSRATVRFSVYAYDGTDSVKVTGDDRVVFVNRYEYLSTESEGIPTEFALHENYPNPFNPTTTLRFDLPEISDITLTIYNMLGQKVKTFNMQSTPAGYHSVTWNATNDLGEQVGAGVYLYQLQTNNFVKTRKMVLLK